MMIVSVILGSTRQGRFSEKPAQWILQHLRKRKDIEARLLDLRDFPMGNPSNRLTRAAIAACWQPPPR
jgi:NAD(P)H-dependent FMN reductase